MAPKPRPTSGLTTALIYTRVSTDEQATQGLSLDTQLDDCRRYAAQQGWSLGQEYQDVMSGKRDDRPQYQRLLADAQRLGREGRAGVVVVAALDRLGRRMLERVRSRKELKSRGVATHSVRDGGEVSDLVANILASVAQEEIQQLGQRVSRVRQHVTAGGWRFPGRAGWGYCWRLATPEERADGAPKSVLVLDPQTESFAREAFARAARGDSFRSIARWIISLPSEARGGNTWSVRATQQLLRAPLAVARPGEPGPDVLDRPIGRWPALVDDGTWAAIQRQHGGDDRLPPQASGVYLLTGFLRCLHCGERMRSNGFQGKVVRYRCGRRDTSERGTCAASCNVGQVDADVVVQVSRVLDAMADADASVRTALRRAWGALGEAHGGADTQARRALEQTAERARGRLKRAAIMYVDDLLDAAGYALARDAAKADLAAADAELSRRGATAPLHELPDLDTVLGAVGGWGAALRDGSPTARRDVLAVLVDRVVPERVRYGHYRALVTWTPTGSLLAAAVASGGEVAA